MKKAVVARQLRFYNEFRKQLFRILIITTLVLGAILFVMFRFGKEGKIAEQILAYIVSAITIIVIVIVMRYVDDIIKKKVKNTSKCNNCSNVLNNEYDLKIVITTEKCPYCGDKIIDG